MIFTAHILLSVGVVDSHRYCVAVKCARASCSVHTLQQIVNRRPHIGIHANRVSTQYVVVCNYIFDMRTTWMESGGMGDWGSHEIAFAYIEWVNSEMRCHRRRCAVYFNPKFQCIKCRTLSSFATKLMPFLSL